MSGAGGQGGRGQEAGRGRVPRLARFVRPAPRERGFTLLEVMVSIGILAVALMAIGDINGTAVRMHSYSKHLVVAVQLAREKMLDLQFQLRKDGLSDFSREYHGDFDKLDRPEYKWKAQVVKPEIDIDSSKMVELIGSGLGLTPKEPGQNAAAQAAANPLLSGPMAGIVDAQAKQFIEVIKGSVREIKLTVTWKEGAKEESVDVVEHVVILPDAEQKAQTELKPQGSSAPALPGQQNPLLNPVLTPPPGPPPRDRSVK